MLDRPTIDVAAPPGGWAPPWPNVAEIEDALPHEKWKCQIALSSAHDVAGPDHRVSPKTRQNRARKPA